MANQDIRDEIKKGEHPALAGGGRYGCVGNDAGQMAP